MQDKHLCCPPYIFLGAALVPHFLSSRIANGQKRLETSRNVGTIVANFHACQSRIHPEGSLERSP